MDIIAGKNLRTANGSRVVAEAALSGKDIICFYFSAHWCPPCRTFTPVLKSFYEEAKNNGVEIIFVSFDWSADDMATFIRELHGDWLAAPFKSEVGEMLKEKFDVIGFPRVVVVRARNNEVITEDARYDIESKGAMVVRDWK